MENVHRFIAKPQAVMCRVVLPCGRRPLPKSPAMAGFITAAAVESFRSLSFA
ncbi:hypothetical protein [Azospirillum melinis]